MAECPALAVVITMINQPEVTRRCLELLAAHAEAPPPVVIVDNGSDPRAEEQLVVSDLPLPVTFLRHPENLGVVDSVLAGIRATGAQVIGYLHNDLLLHEPQWDGKVRQAFAADPQLALAGPVAARGVMPDGTRIDTRSHLLGRELGACDCHEVAWQHHGNLMPPEGIAAATFDGCCLFLRRGAIDAVGLDREYPLHHWYDLEWSCAFLAAGWHLRGLDLQCDHGGGFTTGREKEYHRSAEQCARQRYGITEAPQGWDLAVYRIGRSRWRRKWASRLPAVVEPDHTVRWATG